MPINLNRLPDSLNPKNPVEIALAEEEALSLCDSKLSDEALHSLGNEAPLVGKLAVRLAMSRRAIRRISRPIKLAVVFGMWRETARLSVNSSQNPNGEDCLRRKLEQMHRLLGETNIDWRLIAVDDG